MRNVYYLFDCYIMQSLSLNHYKSSIEQLPHYPSVQGINNITCYCRHYKHQYHTDNTFQYMIANFTYYRKINTKHTKIYYTLIQIQSIAPFIP